MKHGHYFVSLSGATDSDVRDTAGGKSGTAPGKTEEIFALPVEKGEDRHPVVTVSRTEYFFPDYHLVRVSVARTEGMDKEQAELKLREQLQELTEDPDHTYVVCREPLSFYFGREFRDYLQQEWIEHLLRYGERPGGYPAWPDLVLLGEKSVSALCRAPLCCQIAEHEMVSYGKRIPGGGRVADRGTGG